MAQDSRQLGTRAHACTTTNQNKTDIAEGSHKDPSKGVTMVRTRIRKKEHYIVMGTDHWSALEGELRQESDHKNSGHARFVQG